MQLKTVFFLSSILVLPIVLSESSEEESNENDDGCTGKMKRLRGELSKNRASIDETTPERAAAIFKECEEVTNCDDDRFGPFMSLLFSISNSFISWACKIYKFKSGPFSRCFYEHKTLLQSVAAIAHHNASEHYRLSPYQFEVAKDIVKELCGTEAVKDMEEHKYKVQAIFCSVPNKVIPEKKSGTAGNETSGLGEQFMNLTAPISTTNATKLLGAGSGEGSGELIDDLMS